MNRSRSGCGLVPTEVPIPAKGGLELDQGAGCAARWRSSSARWEKTLPQAGQGARSGRCVRMCTLSELFCVKRLAQTAHWKARTPVCVTMCFSR